MTDPRLEHLDPATIAAFVDQTLDPAARAAAEAHLAACADCREAWVETTEIDNEMRGVTTSGQSRDVTVIARPTLKRSWIYGGMGLAAAAAVLLAVFLPRTMDRGDRPELGALVAAVGENRRTEARLTGGFQWGPVPGVTRGSDRTSDTNVDLAVARLQQEAERTNDPDALAASGVATVIGGDVAAGIARLRDATRHGPGSAAAWSNLAAARLEQARRVGDRFSAEEALSDADRALTLRPALPEALFNRALALSYLGRTEDARAAWTAYLAIDSTSAWAVEARRRRDDGSDRQQR